MALPIAIDTPADVLQSVIRNKKSVQLGGVIAESGQVPGDFTSPKLTFTGHLILFSASGSLQVNHFLAGLKTCRYICAPDELIIFPAGESFQWSHRDYGYNCLKLTPNRVNQVLGETLDISQVELRPRLGQADPLLKHLLMQCVGQISNGAAFDHLYIESLSNTLILHLFKHYAVQKKDLPNHTGGLPKYQRLRAIDYIHANLEKDVKLADIAGLLGMSQYYFCRLFRQSMGISPYQYVIQKRVERSKKMLRQPQKLSIAAIALECGFSSQSSLCKHFRNLTGITPNAYRRGV